MIGCILTGHGTFANGLADALSMITGDQDYFIPVPFIEAGAASYPETLASTISDLLDQTDGVLIFCDLLGGTPFNQAMMLSQNYNNVEVVTGTNLPMLLETLSLRLASTTLTDLLQTALESGIAGVSHKTLELPAVVEPALDDDSSFENDGI
ncbi:PTS sugar transporter subunit IIA [Lancefieldella rimae]|uniref:PTS sugar transporter subunit IIA n=1 Tax=Lancefieldella rimae TaxID=1383 RepID=UPI001CAAABE3|nr:PTS sugar transporter subunit IIA [Lancefieldella rimae]MBF4804376.1 PTS sugar transporter subunit IIA [Lancefieldella rimae]